MIAESIRDRLFHPFVSYGKENGTGLGLAAVQKIVQDHGGEIIMERTLQNTTVFRIVLPGHQDAYGGARQPTADEPSLVPARRDDAQNSITHPGS